MQGHYFFSERRPAQVQSGANSCAFRPGLSGPGSLAAFRPACSALQKQPLITGSQVGDHLIDLTGGDFIQNYEYGLLEISCLTVWGHVDKGSEMSDSCAHPEFSLLPVSQ